MQADDAQLLREDQHARVAAIDTSRSFIVQAPAGSGKTELLIQRYLKLLAIVDQPEEILAITFTRKAAVEMRQRIITALQDVRDGREPAELHRRVTFQAAQGALERDRQMAWQLIESPHRLRIQTIDALNAAIARSLPVSSGLGATVDVATDDNARALYRAAAVATLDWLVAGDDNEAAVEKLLGHLDNNSALYTRHIAGMLETRDQWLGITGVGRDQPFNAPAVRARLEDNIARQIAAQLRRVSNLLPPEVTSEILRLGKYAASRAVRQAAPVPALQAFDDYHAVPGVSEGEVDAWRGFAELLLTQSGDWRRAVNVTTGFPPGDNGEKQQMIDLLEALANRADLAAELHQVRALPPARYSDEQWNVLLALMRILPLAVAELRRIFAEQRLTDYIEVAMAAQAALGRLDKPGEIALLLDYSIMHLLIDEMQDTSIAQYDLVEKLVGGWEQGDGRTLFCVGDPMQSIYRFRNAEVGEFLLAREAGVGGVQLDALLLRRNFRSGEHLVHWFNTVFTDVFPDSDDIATGAIAYAESVPVEAHRDAGLVRVYPLFGAAADQETDRALSVIRECLETRTKESVAVLVRSRSQLPPLLAKLRAAGIDYQAIDIDRLTDLPEITDLLALTRALVHRADRIAWLGLLRGPWLGLDWKDLHALVVHDGQSTVWELLQDDARLAALSPGARDRIGLLRQEIAPALDGHGTRTLQESVEQLWYRLGGPFLLDDASQVENVYRFFDVLERLETAGTLADVVELETRLDLDRVPSRAPAGTRLQIMTMHKSKGLQFDHVVLYGLGHRTKPDSKAVLSWLSVPDARGGKDVLISPLGARTDLQSDPLHNLIDSRLREKDRLEKDRLLYVACTRARQSLHLIGHVPLMPDGEDFREPHAGSLLRCLWPAVRRRYADAFDGAQKRPASDARGGHSDLRAPVRRQLRTVLPKPAIPPMPAPRQADSPAEPAPERTVDYYWVGSAARQAGTIVHRCLQQLSDGQLALEDVHGEQFAPLIRRWATELGVPASEVGNVFARVSDAVDRISRDSKGHWIVFGPGHVELPVSGVYGGRVESIVIDRVRIDAGVHWIVDYKTGSHEGGDLGWFLEQEAARYRPQLLRYATLYRNLADTPVRAALYYPLLREFVEVSVDTP